MFPDIYTFPLWEGLFDYQYVYFASKHNTGGSSLFFYATVDSCPRKPMELESEIVQILKTDCILAVLKYANICLL